jgi:type VI secretion system secreted protein VgrG
MKNQHSTCWIRVSSPWAGNQLGGMHIPRVGQEVVVDFYGGDPDLPICTGRVYNQMNLPPWSLPSQSALSGYRSRELTPDGGNSAAGRSNHMLMDDTAGQIQAQLKSDHQHSSLSLGSITRVEDNAGRKDPRGQGFELRTDGHGVLRVANGLLITSEARMNAAGHVKDLGEAIQRLTLARDLVEGQADAARTSEAQIKGDQDAVAKALKQFNDSIKGSGGDPQKGQFPELADPHLVLASPSGMALTSGGSTHIASTEHSQVTSSKHTSLNSGGSLIAVALEAFKVYAMQNGMEMIAAQADIEIKALKNSIKLTAKDRIELTADVIAITAKTKLTINGGGSYEEFSAGKIETGTTGGYTNHAQSHAFVGPGARPTTPVNGEACATKEHAADMGGNSVSR